MPVNFLKVLYTIFILLRTRRLTWLAMKMTLTTCMLGNIAHLYYLFDLVGDENDFNYLHAGKYRTFILSAFFSKMSSK